PVGIPASVTVSVDGPVVTVNGPKGELVRTINDKVSASVEDGSVLMARTSDERSVRALHGLTRALIANMMVGVTDGYRKDLAIAPVGFRAAKKGSDLVLLVGFTHPVLVPAIDGVDVEVPEPTKLVVSGIDKELVGQVAANIRRIKPPEPYKG